MYEPFWGPPTSSINWCEQDYLSTPYLAELHNSISSLLIILFSLLGLASPLSRRWTAWWWTWIGLQVVGWGSIAFHATLKKEGQWMDEGPMVWTCLVVIYIFVRARYQKEHRKKVQWFKSFAVGYGVVCTALITILRGPVQFTTFHILFGIIEFSGLALTYLAVPSSSSFSPNTPSSTTTTTTTIPSAQEMRSLFRLGTSLYALGVAFWMFDLHLCSHLSPLGSWPNPQGHAVWHACVSAGFYVLNLICGIEDAGARGEGVRVRWWGGYLPLLVPADEKGIVSVKEKVK
ncbi:alkaline phytoceramidase [Saitoella complicata NRRL Y-17804]|uniref:Uncharacterized protein n=1 Tax=Saitoella complicata (strain BCRC 22490 / CBS 7301 / JCM 7358 / NBRC 10748 / NRRL Y-17804) TaxID=698492 RepID=A0A0E9ND33_SAICN|nr:alkaline phytoceramidase [Saitoella complicata NRRL Y-17804]ODQ51567.1 alkaline phytoceramidase [Saitoella complicata NRRL Y-17804]GAO47320.1 hypothetical protein G7K_1528-t1 [Saitoella complicata NRRL Y-17804]